MEILTEFSIIALFAALTWLACSYPDEETDVPTVLDQITGASATAAAKVVADAAAAAADAADAAAQSTLLGTLAAVGPVAVLAADSTSVTVYSATPAPNRAIVTTVIGIASLVNVPDPTPPPAPPAS